VKLAEIDIIILLKRCYHENRDEFGQKTYIHHFWAHCCFYAHRLCSGCCQEPRAYIQADRLQPVLDIAEGPNKVTVNGDLFVAGKISSPSLIVCPLQTCVELAADYNHCTCGGACTGGFVISGGGDCRTNGWVVESRPSAVDTWVLACNDLIAMQKPNNFYILCGKLGG